MHKDKNQKHVVFTFHYSVRYELGSCIHLCDRISILCAPSSSKYIENNFLLLSLMYDFSQHFAMFLVCSIQKILRRQRLKKSLVPSGFPEFIRNLRANVSLQRLYIHKVSLRIALKHRISIRDLARRSGWTKLEILHFLFLSRAKLYFASRFRH